MEESGLIDGLLKLPPYFKRDKYSSSLYCPYSRKNSRRVYLYTPVAYALWVNLESDPTVVRFNERVPKVSISVNGKAVNAAPDAVSIDKARLLTVHSISREISPSSEEIDGDISWDGWAKSMGFLHIEWNLHTLKSNKTKYLNQKRLLRFVSAPGMFPDILLEQALIAEIGVVSRITWFKLLEKFPQADPSKLQSSISRLIVDCVISSDIDTNPLSMRTVMWINHGSEKN